MSIERKLDLILRGQHILIRMSAAPNDQRAKLEHYTQLQKDIGPWLGDYVTVLEGPAPAREPPALADPRD